MFKIKGTEITLTKGDSFYCQISLKKDGQAYTPQEGDVISFCMKEHYWDEEAVIEKTVPNGTMVLYLSPEDTEVPVNEYVYDLQMTFANGDIDTFVNHAKFKIVPEVLAPEVQP